MKAVYLYLPMEIAVREFDSRLLIALIAVENGMEVIMGQKWLMEKNIEAMPPGLWIFKTMTKRDSKRMARCKAAGHTVASIDEEVPATAEGSGELLWVSDEAVRLCDRIFCLGEEHRKSLVGKWPATADKLLITGNPRWDYLRQELSPLYAAKAREYNDRFGRIILMNTNNGSVNPEKKNAEDVFKDYVKAKKIDPNNAQHMALWNDFIAFEQANFAATVPLARELAAAFPKHTLILRPHPGERLATYAEQLSDLANVKVLFEGSAAPWIMASDVMVHTGCTTGIEAFAMGKPCINFESLPSRLNKVLLSTRLGFTARTVNDVVAEARRIVDCGPDGSPYPIATTETFRRFFSAQSGPLAAERVVDAARQLLGGTSSHHAGIAQWHPRWTYKTWWPSKSYNRKMFPPIDTDALGVRLNALAAVLKKPSRPAFVTCGDSMVHLFPAHLKAPKPVGTLPARLIGQFLFSKVKAEHRTGSGHD